MYKLAKMFKFVGTLCLIYCAVLIVAMGWPESGWIGAFFGFCLIANRGYKRLTTLGSARWAEERDLKGMLGAKSGLILGRLPGRNDLVRLPRAIHTAVFSPSGGGKGVSCVIPFLLTCEDSCVVVDFKAENAARTAAHRRKVFGHRVVLLDPFKVVTKKPDNLNPLDFIGKDHELAIDECNDLAKALVIRTGEEKEPHWNDSAETWIASELATVVEYGETDTRSLQSVREILSHPEKLEMSIKLMAESDAWGGMLARMGGQLMHFVEKEKASTLTTVSRHLRFLDTPAIAESTKASSFDPADLRNGKMTVYLVLPPEHMRAQSALLRMWIGSLLRAVIRGGLQETNKVHFILDEAASLGHLEAVDDAVDKYRGYGIRLQFYFQSLGQLRRCFPEGQEQTLLSNTSQVYFGVNDNGTADYVSARLGEETIIVDSGGSSRGMSRQVSFSNPHESSGRSDNANSNWQQQARKLLKPEEVIALPPRVAITFTPGVPPIRTTLLRYYEENIRPGWLRRSVAACVALAMAVGFCVLSMSLAALMTLAMNQ